MLDKKAGCKQYNLIEKDKDQRSMWTDIQKLQCEPIDPDGEYLVNLGQVTALTKSAQTGAFFVLIINLFLHF